MTTQHRAPQHGGLQRVAFDGGQTFRGELPFNAQSVNIDNWSPYWYKLNPIEEYIPPFQHGVNVKLPLIHSYEFVCQAPPGIFQSTIVPTTGIAGNTSPVIAVFSSFDTNNDAGFSALEASSNQNTASNAFSGITTINFDLTLYDGLYLTVLANTQLVIILEYFDLTGGTTIIYTRVLSVGMRLFFTIPKLYRFVTLILTIDPNNNPGAISGVYSFRPFLGALPFSAQLMPKQAIEPAAYDNRQVVGESTVTFTVKGLDSAYLTVSPNGGAGVTNATIYWIKVFAQSLSFSGDILLYSKTFVNPVNPATLIVPLTGLLSEQVNTITVFIRPSEAGVTLATAITQIALHQTTPDANNFSTYNPPTALIGRFIINPAVGWNLLGTLPVGGMLTAFTVSNRVAVAAGNECVFALGTPATQDIVFGTIPAFTAGLFSLSDMMPLRTDNGFNSFWVFATIIGTQLDISYRIE